MKLQCCSEARCGLVLTERASCARGESGHSPSAPFLAQNRFSSSPFREIPNPSLPLSLHQIQSTMKKQPIPVTEL